MVEFPKTMKTKILLIIVLALLSVRVIAQGATVPVKLAWNPISEPGVTYTVYASQSASALTNNLAVGVGGTPFPAGTNLTATANVTAGTRWFYVATAMTPFKGESAPSNMVSYIAPTPPASPSLSLTLVLPEGTTVTSSATNITVTFP